VEPGNKAGKYIGAVLLIIPATDAHPSTIDKTSLFSYYACIRKMYGGIYMSQITLRQLPDNLERQIRRLADENNTSINKTIIRLLHRALGLTPGEDKKRDLSEIAGSWSAGEVREFEENLRIFEKIDEEIWDT
jgi:hypothetical protein